MLYITNICMLIGRQIAYIEKSIPVLLQRGLDSPKLGEKAVTVDTCGDLDDIAGTHRVDWSR